MFISYQENSSTVIILTLAITPKRGSYHAANNKRKALNFTNDLLSPSTNHKYGWRGTFQNIGEVLPKTPHHRDIVSR